MRSTASPSFDAVVAALEAKDWRFAKSMPTVPHWYTLRKDWVDAIEFETLVQFMRDHGTPMRWGRMKPKPYFDANGWRYWTMGSPLHETILINRERIETSKAVPA